MHGFDPGHVDVRRCRWDAGAAAATAVHHLIDQGRKRVGFLGLNYRMQMSQAGFEAYRKVLKKNQLTLNPKWVFQPVSTSTIEEIVEPGLNRMFAGIRPHPDALFVLNDGIALPTLESLARRGLRVPDDVAVVSMGDLPLTGHSAIGLSTMREPVEELGRGAAEVALGSSLSRVSPQFSESSPAKNCTDDAQRWAIAGSSVPVDAYICRPEFRFRLHPIDIEKCYEQ